MCISVRAWLPRGGIFRTRHRHRPRRGFRIRIQLQLHAHAQPRRRPPPGPHGQLVVHAPSHARCGGTASHARCQPPDYHRRQGADPAIPGPNAWPHARVHCQHTYAPCRSTQRYSDYTATADKSTSTRTNMTSAIFMLFLPVTCM